MSQTEIYLVQAVAALFCFGFVPLLLMIITRERLQRFAITHVLCEFITPHQTGFTKMLPEVGGFVQLPSASKEGIPKTFPVGTDATLTVAWPDYFPRIVKVMARKIIFHTETWEPVSRIGENNPILDPILKPEFITIMQAEAASAQVIRRAQEDSGQEIPSRGGRRFKISFTQLVVLILLGIGIYLLIWFLQNKEIFEKLPAALGVE